MTEQSRNRLIVTPLTKLLNVDHPIISANMCGMSMGKLAGSVASVGGIGLISIGANSIFKPDRLREEYHIAQNIIHSKKSAATTTTTTTTTTKGALGFGFLENFMNDTTDDDNDIHDETFDACLEFQPDVIFLSGFISSKEPLQDAKHRILIKKVRMASPRTKVIIQSFTVDEALKAAKDGADAVVIQGCDAGGHGRQNHGASIISLIPQTRYVLEQAGYANCIVLAAGGIATGKQLAAALTLGADGVVMGSAFVVTEECLAKDTFKNRILETADGTSQTIISDVWDHLSKPMGTPFVVGNYVGRALSDSESVRKFKNKDPRTETTQEDIDWYSKSDYKGRAVWCSTSTGLLQRQQQHVGGDNDEPTTKSYIKASDLVESTIKDAIQTLQTSKHFKIETTTV